MANDVEQRVSQLEAIEQIRALKARYFRCVDEKDWEGFGDTLTQDVVCAFRALRPESPRLPQGLPALTGAPITGRSEVLKFVKTAIQHATTVHQAHGIEIEITGADAATGICAMTDILRFDTGPTASIVGHGHYRETYVRQAGKWRIATLALTRLSYEVTPRGSETASVAAAQ